MPVCQVCQGHIPNSAIIDGVRHNLCKRRRCLSCSPFKSGTRLLKGGSDCVCAQCGKAYTYNHKDRQGHSRTKCNSCMCNSKRNANKARAVAYLGGCCKVCGYSRCFAALSFHHVDGTGKDFTISNRRGCAWETIKKELDKCILLCTNCHAEIHAGVADTPEIPL